MKSAPPRLGLAAGGGLLRARSASFAERCSPPAIGRSRRRGQGKGKVDSGPCDHQPARLRREFWGT